jgi:hypothetical protein
MRHISALLEQELLGWPGVTARPMFGMRALYRGTAIFAMLPNLRALENPSAIAYKPGGAKESQSPKWRLLELKNEQDLTVALACLDKAYRGAAGR